MVNISNGFSVFLNIIYICLFILSVGAFIIFLFSNEYNRNFLKCFDIKKFFNGFLITVFLFLISLIFFKVCAWGTVGPKESQWNISDKPYATEQIYSKEISLENDSYKFSVYNYNGIPTVRSVRKNFTSFYYKDIDKAYVEWYKDYSSMMGMKQERIRIKLYLPESWRNS